jgi:hypothetical protein
MLGLFYISENRHIYSKTNDTEAASVLYPFLQRVGLVYHGLFFQVVKASFFELHRFNFMFDLILYILVTQYILWGLM